MSSLGSAPSGEEEEHAVLFLDVLPAELWLAIRTHLAAADLASIRAVTNVSRFIGLCRRVVWAHLAHRKPALPHHHHTLLDHAC